MKFTIVFIVMMFMSHQLLLAQQGSGSYNSEDRDRAIRMESKMYSEFNRLESKMNSEFNRLETKMDSQFNRLETKMNSEINRLETKMDVQFNSLQKQIDQLSSMFYWGFGILVTLFLFNLGYTIWDRRTAIKPALDKAECAEIKSFGILRALRDYSKDHPDLANILKLHGLL